MTLLTSAEWIFLGAGVVVLGVDALAVKRVFTAPFYEPPQRWTQAALILFVPIFGAALALYLSRENVPLFQSQPVIMLKILILPVPILITMDKVF